MNLSNEQIKKILDEAPEGATHWWTLFNSNFINGDGFYGVYEEDVLLGGDLWNQIPLSDLRKQLEGGWINGDECLYLNAKTRHVFIGADPRRDGYCYIQAPCYSVNFVEISKLSKPETEAEKAERERLEAAYDLYCLWRGEKQESFESFSGCNVDNWLAIVDKTKYRKEVGLYRA